MIRFLLCAVLFALMSAFGVASVRITSPANGSAVLIDSTVTIRWEGANGAAVSLWYSTDSRKTWNLIASDIQTDSHLWTVPDLPSDSIAFRIEVLTGASPTPLRTFRAAHAGEIRAASFSRDGRLLLSAGRDGFVKVRDLVTGEVDSAALANGGEIYSAKFGATTDTVFVHQSDNIFLWDRIRDVIEPMELEGVPDAVLEFRTLDVFPERRLLVAGGDYVAVWDYKTHRLLAIISGPVLTYTVSFSHDGSRIVYAGDNGVVYEWEWEKTLPPQVYRQHGSGSLNLVVWSCAFAPGDTMIASGGVDATARLWQKSAGDTTVQKFTHNSHVRSVAWSVDGRRILSGSLDSTIRQWNVGGGQIGDSLNHGAQVLATAYSPTSDTILSAGRDGTMILWKSGFSAEGRDTASYALGRECVLEIPQLTGEVGRGLYVPLVWRNRVDIPEFMTAEGIAVIELPNTLLETVSGGNTLERRRGTTRDTVLLPVRPGIPGDTIAVVAARVLLGVPVRQEIRILSVEWQPGVRLVPTTVDGSITVKDTCGLLTLRAVDFADRNAALSVAPNPVVEDASVTFVLAVDEQPHIAVYDARGVEVAVVRNVPSRAGVHTVGLPVERLTAGEYFVRLHTGGRQYSTKFTVVR